ncbi:hypothetical protein I4U23_030359 [Adineta vaga]|nr:hypothetical protein I4U23_030359 [Adineta vaga]
MTNTTTTTSNDIPASDEPTELDLAFIIDATGSMGSYIKSAQENMRKIIEDIIISERCSLNTALILYRDHPPQDSTFVIKLHEFTDDAEEAKKHIDSASASGGGDGPEAVAPALHAAVHTLSWRKNAIKIALLIADAPPHGLGDAGDAWPQGDPSGHDPIESVTQLAENSITLYTIGCEPGIIPYRDFFMALAFKTGGQYIPLNNCDHLASIIIGSAKEEISLERLLAQVHEEVMREAALRGGPVDETELTRRIHEVMQGGGAKARRVKINNQDGSINIPQITPAAEDLSKLTTLKEVREKWTTSSSKTTLFSTPAVGFGGLFGTTATIPTPPAVSFKKTRKHMTAPSLKKTALKRKTPPKPEPTIKKKPRQDVPRGKRRSTRLILNRTNDQEDTTDEEKMDTTSVPTPPVTKPAKIKTEISHIDLKDDELLDISQTRRLVRKCVARNKIKST